jgi:TPR repeat protein
MTAPTVARSLVVIAGACLPAAWATPSNFQSALSEYRAGHYDAAHAGFLSLAELGDCSSQFNLGAMALHGQGGPKDQGSGAGWLEAAAGNGCGQLVGDRLRGLTASLNAEETRAAAAIMARYGPEALHAQGIVNPEFTCRGVRPASVATATEPDTSDAAIARYPALVITALTIGTDGHARDPEVLLAFPAQGFAPAAVEAWLNSQFAPAQGPEGPAASRLEAKTLFARSTASLANAEPVRSVRSAADAGDPAASYLLGLAGAYEPSLGITTARAEQLLLGAARDGNADAQYWVASQLRASAACHPGADGQVWLRHAAEGGNASAQLLLARDLLAGTAGADQVAQARALLEQAAHADSYYVRKHLVALLAASPLDAVRNPPAALELARRLSAGEIKSDPQMFEAVAAAYAANGDFRSATAQEQLAVETASGLRWNTRAMQERLDAYRHGKTWRGDLLASS